MKEMAAIYTRVSTEEQIKGFSLDAQVDELQKYAESKNLHVANIYRDEGWSGKDFNRPEFQRMMRDLDSGKFTVLLIWQVDRISRNTKDILTLIEDELNPRNCRLLISMGDLDTSTHVGYLTLSLLGTIAQYERSSIISRVKLGMEKRASSGYWNGGLIYGYDNIDKKLIVNIEESKIVQRIYQLRLQSLGYKAIASRLNEQGIPTKSGKMFSIQSIKTILNNPTYIGINRWGYYKDWEKVRRSGLNNNPILTEGHHEAIIEKSLWEKVQAIQNVSKASVSKNKNFNGDFLLSGILRCPKCGAGTVMTKRKKYDGSGYHLYYMCQAYHSKGKTACSVNLIQKEHVERQVIQTIKGLVYDSSIIEDVLQKLKSDLEANTYHLKSSLDVYRKKHAKAEGNQKKLDTDYFENRLSAEHYNRLSEPLLIAKKEFEVEISKIEHELNRESLESFIDKETISLALKNFDDLFDSAATEQKKALIRALIKRIDVEQDRKNIKEIVFWFTDESSLPLSNTRRTVP